jgi:hypothetical protein
MKTHENPHQPLLTPTSSALPGVAGRMEMTHADFQRACAVAINDLQATGFEEIRAPGVVHLLCEAVRCSRECCELVKSYAATCRVLVDNDGIEPVYYDGTKWVSGQRGSSTGVCLKPGEAIAVIKMPTKGQP